MNGQLLDLSSPVPTPASMAIENRRESSRYLGVQFACCDVYSRIYANRAGTEYVGHCPRCAKRVRFEIGPGGSDSRFFIAQ
jgi:hypothetical protein